MPEQYPQIASGVLFKNERKQEGSKQPDYTGPGETQDGRKVKLAAWLKQKNGRTFMSWAVQEDNSDKDQQQSHPQQAGGDVDSADIPF